MILLNCFTGSVLNCFTGFVEAMVQDINILEAVRDPVTEVASIEGILQLRHLHQQKGAVE